jgi:hypothetical protein
LDQGGQGGNAGRVELEKTQTDGQNRYQAGGPLNQVSMAVGRGGDGRNRSVLIFPVSWQMCFRHR